MISRRSSDHANADTGPSRAERAFVLLIVAATLLCGWLTVSAVILELMTRGAAISRASASPHSNARHLRDGFPGPSVVGPRGYPHTTGLNSGGRAPGASAGFFPGL